MLILCVSVGQCFREKILFYPQNFCQATSLWRPKEIFFIFRFFFLSLCPSRGMNQEIWYNKPTHYLLDYLPLFFLSQFFLYHVPSRTLRDSLNKIWFELQYKKKAFFVSLSCNFNLINALLIIRMVWTLI